MKRTAALLLLMGLMGISAANAEEKKPVVPPDQAELQKARSGEDYITLNFTNIDINALIKVMSELTRRNFILDERVVGKITLMTPTKISPDEAYQVFLSALEIKGFTAIEDGAVIRIIPAASARQSGLKVLQDGSMSGEGYVTKLIRMSFVNPQEIVRTISPLITKDGTLIAYPTTNSIIITDSVHNIRKIESLIHAMDVAAPEGKGKINVYYLRNANAEDIAKLMQALVARLPVPPAGGAAQPAGPSTILEGAVTITADKTTNSLIIVASPGDFEIMKDVIQKLDIRRRQVYVEAAIIEMGLAKQRELGFEFRAVNQLSDSGTNAVGGTNFGGIANATVGGPAAFAGFNGLAVGAVKGTFSFKGVEYMNIGALLRAVQTDGDVNVLSTPNILTMDNQKAKIMVGENVPFIGSQTQTPATAGSILTAIDRKDVGLTMELTPQITSEDNVKLELNLEISNVIATAGLNPNLVGPSTSKRSASTTVVVRDKETMVIGGLIRDNATASTIKVPLLGDIPILGWFFKYKTTKIEKTNLMIFITPYVIKGDAEASELTRHKKETLDEFRKEYRIDKKDRGLPGAHEKKPLSGEQSGSGQEPAAGRTQSAPSATTVAPETSGPAEGAR